MRAIALAVCLILPAAAQADVLANWTFETSIPATAGPFAAEAGVNAASSWASGYHASASVVYSNPVGNGSLESFSSNYWSADDYYQFTTSTVGYTGIQIQWDQYSSSTGPTSFDLVCSTDGTNWTTLVDNYTVLTTPSMSSTTPHPELTFAAVAAPASLDNQATVYFRLVSQVTSATAGTDRVDNVIISTVPEPTTLVLLALGCLGLRRRKIA